VVSQAAAFVVADILADRDSRSVTFGLESPLATRFWSAVKTGTSKDMRDNWCVGFSSRYTVAAWVGNFEGDSMHDVSGVTGAAPVWSELMTELHREGVTDAPQPPPGVLAVNVTFQPAVESSRREWFVVGTQSAPVSPAAVPAETVHSVPAAAAIARIESPANGTVIALDPDIPPNLQRVPISARGAVESMRFRLDDAVLGEARTAVLWPPRPGYHTLVLEDRNGREADRVHFTVR
jgi:penicillin-binding protein 1C